MAIALLHASARLSPSFSVHPSTVIGIIGLAVLYERGSKGWGRAARDGAPQDARPSTLQHVWYYVALLVMFFSLNGWLHDLSDGFLFSAHMVQHIMITLVVPPIMIMATPGGMLRPALAIPGVAPVARFITKPVHAFAIFIVTFAGWHLPPLYNYALEHHPVHIVEHLMFMVSSVLMWWPVLSPMPELPRLSYPGQMLYLFLLSIPMSIVSVYITYADTLLYPFYATAPRVWGITPMNDQLIGGLIMWIPGGLFFYGIISVIFFRWQQRDGVETQAGAQVDYALTTAK
ncbi:MAG TPA: cytochrome c oxidase assembly protein [Gemmatimonadaceae bacterium]|nr:cytochrome c oxidase assembly protein [Gemmatimonadaceae bacterium]